MNFFVITYFDNLIGFETGKKLQKLCCCVNLKDLLVRMYNGCALILNNWHETDTNWVENGKYQSKCVVILWTVSSRHAVCMLLLLELKDVWGRVHWVLVTDTSHQHFLFHPHCINMSRPFNSGVFLSYFLHGLAIFADNISTPNMSFEKDNSQFVQLRASLPSYSQPIQPYSLWTSREDYYYLPKPKQRRPSRLLRLLGPHFDPFWMSVDQPIESAGVWMSNRDHQHNVRKRLSLKASPQLKQAAETHRLELIQEAADLDLKSFPSDVARTIRDWLVDSATCGLRYQWVDLGKAFWPRWLRHTDCERADVTHKCSFPSGMVCKRSQTVQIKILAWHCQELTEKTKKPTGTTKDDAYEGISVNGTMKTTQLCRWRQVPYPVVTACECSCK